jgi:hypothetical protein
MVGEEKKRKRRKGCLVVLAVLLLPVVLFPKRIYYTLNAFLDVQKAGFLDATKQRKYSASSMENLKALYQAVSLYYESEGVMPHAAGWMDAAKTYVRTNDLKRGEEMKKFVNPRIEGGEGVYGYAFNDALSGVYREDVADPAGTPMIFESSDTAWNAHGEPAALQPDPELEGGNLAVTAEGSAKPLRDLLDADRRVDNRAPDPQPPTSRD